LPGWRENVTLWNRPEDVTVAPHPSPECFSLISAELLKGVSAQGGIHVSLRGAELTTLGSIHQLTPYPHIPISKDPAGGVCSDSRRPRSVSREPWVNLSVKASPAGGRPSVSPRVSEMSLVELLVGQKPPRAARVRPVSPFIFTCASDYILNTLGLGYVAPPLLANAQMVCLQPIQVVSSRSTSSAKTSLAASCLDPSGITYCSALPLCLPGARALTAPAGRERDQEPR
jgi:hypothetical protein